MKRLLHEPLFHFLLLGAGLFLVHGLLQQRGGGPEPGQIVVTRGHIEQLAFGFAKTWQRQPSPEELAGLVRDRVREEVYCREALALGLEREDVVVRRRLRQKMEFISDDIAALVEPSDAELEEYLRTHAESFRVEPRITFEQVHLDPEKHGIDLAGDAARLLAQLEQGNGAADPSALGDSRLLETRFEGLPLSEVAKQFGEPFARALGGLQPARWHGPIASGYGAHLVLVVERAEGRLPPLAEVRDLVRREWENARRLAANEAFYQELLGRYTVTIEGLEPADEAEVRAAGKRR